MVGDEERARILRMVAGGKLSPEDAASLLEAVEPEPEPQVSSYSIPPEAPYTAHEGSVEREVRIRGREGHRSRPPRAVVIQIKENGENKVNLRIPLGLARAAKKFIPRQAQNYLSGYEIDLQEFLDGANDMEGGTILEVKDGENRVLIAVE
jgi:acetylornithine deacetylase/succinyl-diaminopimelate desuccinylase-like protein